MLQVHHSVAKPAAPGRGAPCSAIVRMLTSALLATALIVLAQNARAYPLVRRAVMASGVAHHYVWLNQDTQYTFRAWSTNADPVMHLWSGSNQVAQNDDAWMFFPGMGSNSRFTYTPSVSGNYLVLVRS